MDTLEDLKRKALPTTHPDARETLRLEVAVLAPRYRPWPECDQPDGDSTGAICQDLYLSWTIAFIVISGRRYPGRVADSTPGPARNPLERQAAGIGDPCGG